MWTEERRKHARERMMRVKPWERSTGPVTEAGKAVSALNNLRHGMRSADAVACRKLMAEMDRETREILRIV